MTQRIYLSVPHMGGRELDFVKEAFETNWLSSVGPNLDAFEADVSARLGHGRQALAVSSGTAAIHLILRWIGVSRGDRVAVSTLTFAGSVFPILYQDAVPVFVDSENVSGNIDPGLLESYFRQAGKSGTLPKALIAVHLYGQHCDIDAIADLCRRFGVVLVEDAAESLGATYRGRETGTTADFAALSFNGNKIITTTGGGMVLARDAAAIASMRKWANQSREPAVEYRHKEVGFNYRLSNVLAGIGRGQLEVLDDRVAARQRIAARYAAALSDEPGVRLQPEAPWGMHSRWLTVMYLDPEQTGTGPMEVVRILAELDIEARPVWRPMHQQELFQDAACIGGEVADALFATGICLPSSSSLSDADQDRVISGFREALRRSPGRRTR